MVDFDTTPTLLFKSEDQGWLPAASQSINRGFLFGDGLFETMAFIAGRIRFAELHEKRIKEGCRVLGLNTESLSSLGKIEEIAAQVWTEKSPARIRWNVWRAGTGKYTPETDALGELVSIQRFDPAPIVKHGAYVSRNIRVAASSWSQCKTLNALTYVMANRERKERKADEVVLLDGDGFVSEAGSSNIFWKKGGFFFTPSLDCSCIEGVGRNVVTQYLEKTGRPVKQGRFRPAELLQADCIFTTNATGISFLSSLDGIGFDPKPIADLVELFGSNTTI